MTSSDVLDTCFNIQLLQSGKIIIKDIDEILKVLKNKSLKYKNTVCIGRSHGIHAEPTTFGLKLASFYEEFKRIKREWKMQLEKFLHALSLELSVPLQILILKLNIMWQKI